MENREFPRGATALHALPGYYEFGANFGIFGVENPGPSRRGPATSPDPLQRLHGRSPFVLFDPIFELREDG